MLFDEQELIAKNTGAVDGTKITQVLLYFDEPDAIEFKRLCKAGMVAESKKVPLIEANLCDFLLTLLKNTYGK